ncbi:MAG TPA: Do family serine endopeptidase [Gammaproteobacteria bacterium]|nr:Do family serine endopeptidase [Gammaproteobacteria bacterium]
MSVRKTLTFALQSVTVGLALAFVIVVARPDLLGLRPAVVEVQQVHESPAASARRLPAPLSYSAAVRRAAPAVVNIYTAKMVTERTPLSNDPLFQYFFGKRYSRTEKHMQTSLGSGVLVSPQGYVLTNHHVVEGAQEIQVLLDDGRRTEAKVVGVDADTDLAVVKINLHNLPSIVIGDSDHLQVGDVVLAIGNPFGVGQTVTQGIVSATGRNRLGINTFEDFIQTDAAINPGNSGGALVNANGELVGINTAIFTQSGGSEGIGFAIPVSLAQGVMKQIIEHGHVVRGWLGIEVQDLTPALAQSFGLDSTEGVLIAGVLRNGPADNAGLRPGDVITAVDGKPVDNARNALQRISRIRPGTRIELQGVRQGARFRLQAQVTERPVRNGS